MKTMKHKLNLIIILAVLPFGFAHAQLGYFAFIDQTHKTLYITERTDLKTEKGRLENVNYVEGFIQHLGWTDEERKKFNFSHDYEFVGNIEEFKKFAYNKRERRISMSKEQGLKIVTIPVPIPKPLNLKTNTGGVQ